MITRNYSFEDSREIRRIFFEACRKQPGSDTRKKLITLREWQRFQAQRQEMSKYEVIQDFFKRLRKQEFEKFKKQRESAKNGN